MRHRVVRVAVIAVSVALLLLALPLGAAIRLVLVNDERSELQRQALTAAVQVGPDSAAGDPVELPVPESGTRLGLYDRTLHLNAGTGPADADPASRTAAAGTVVQATYGGELIAAVPVAVGEQTIGVVRASSPTRQVWKRVVLAWLILLAAALTALTCAILLARRQARALSTPLEALSAQARAVADGDLAARAETCGIPEIDQVAHTQNTMVTRLASLLRHEREFTANASHQLRTALTGLQLGLEAATDNPRADQTSALEQALERSRHLQTTIDEVLRLSKPDPAGTPPATQAAADLLAALERRWHGVLAQEGRPLRVTTAPEARNAALPGQTVTQILDILLDNARRHGLGAIDVTLREVGGAIAVDVADEGRLALDAGTAFDRGATTGGGQGIGLALARELAESAGGRLRATGTAPTVFTLLLPG